MSDYPVRVDALSPAHFDRVQLLLRIGLAIVLGAIGLTGAWLIGILYLALPIFAATAISSEGGDGYLSKVAPKLWRVLSWLLQLSAFMALLVDRFPTEDTRAVSPMIQLTGKPTVESALLRLLTSVPSGFVLGLLSCISCLLWVVAAMFVLVDRRVPVGILAFQRGMLRWQARLVAYHASLVAEYPPWVFDTGASAGGLAEAGAR